MHLLHELIEFAQRWQLVAGVPGGLALPLLVVAALLAKLRARRDVAIGLIVLAWQLAFVSVVTGFVDAFDCMGHHTRCDHIVAGMARALGSAAPAVLLTVPALWFALEGEGVRFARSIRPLGVSILVALADILLLMWVIPCWVGL